MNQCYSVRLSGRDVRMIVRMTNSNCNRLILKMLHDIEPDNRDICAVTSATVIYPTSTNGSLPHFIAFAGIF